MQELHERSLRGMSAPWGYPWLERSAMRAVDTNVVVRLITRDDEKQYQRATLLGLIWVSHLVLLETVWVLQKSYDFEPERVFGAVDGLLKHEQVVLEEPLVVQAVLRRLFQNLKLDFADVLILEVARAANRGPLFTFDKALAKVDGVQMV